MEIKSFAKINLTLDSLYKREDGYHEIDSIMTKINLYDTIYIEKNDTSDIKITTNIKELETDQNNLVYKAHKILKDRFDIGGVDIHIKKNIPIAAGLAGGSSNAAYTMIALNKIFNLNLDKKEMMKLSKPIGADVPFFFCKNAARARGIGEKLEEFENKLKLNILLVNDLTPISSVFVYKRLKDYGHIDNETIVKKLQNNDSSAISMFENVMEDVVYENFKHLKLIKEELEKSAKKVLLSGSGASIFAIYNSKDEVKRAMEKLNYPFMYEVSI
ncbi:MAG: 4-(cytidine 5'-diphospho)-2-C-methyl-D-erythritol kinase [Tissierellia bacterium]|nr:4-(cytidine 5'-diphospho)-2-C-methyl-D-erythritol kinase [Tissierellia bacterium]